jgi:general secretion pathway protein N
MVERQMIAVRWLVCMAAFMGVVIAGDVTVAAVHPSGFDNRDQLNGPPGALNSSPEPEAPATAGNDTPTSANPLWAIPLGTLTATGQRPLFSPSRRPPVPPAVPAARVEPAKSVVEPVKPVYVPTEPEKPQLSLVGVVSGISDGYAVFISATTHDIVRLKLGEGHEGWVLRSVKGREAVLEKNHQTAIIGLPTLEDIQK